MYLLLPISNGAADPPPTISHSYLGDAIPTGFVNKNANGGYFLTDPLNFQKWHNGAFSEPGIGGLDSDPIPAGACTGKPQYHPEVSYNDDLGLYLMLYWCGSAPNGATVTWYYSTATSLDLQDWTRRR